MQGVAHRASSRSASSSVSSLLPLSLWRGGLPGLSLLFTLRAVQPRSSWSLQISPEAGAGQTSLMFSFCAPAFVKQDTRVGREVASHHHSLTTLWPLRLPSSGPGAPWFCLQALQLPLKPLAFALVSREILSGHGVGWGIIPAATRRCP